MMLAVLLTDKHVHKKYVTTYVWVMRGMKKITRNCPTQEGGYTMNM